MQEILDFVSEKENITQIQIKNKNRNEDVVIARHIFMYMALLTEHHTTTVIAEFVNKTHATVLHAKKKCLNKSEYKLQERLKNYTL